MMKRIYIHDKKDCFQVSRQVETIDGLPIHYGPVFKIDKKDFSIESLTKAMFSSFDNAGLKLELPPFSENKEAYQEYKTNILKEYNERSFQQLAKKSTLYILDWEGQEITFLPTIYSNGGSEGDEENYKKISIYGKMKSQIAEEIIDLISEYHQNGKLS